MNIYDKMYDDCISVAYNEIVIIVVLIAKEYTNNDIFDSVLVICFICIALSAHQLYIDWRDYNAFN